MITWNYRVFREENGDYTIREVIYDDDGAVLGCTADPVEPYGQSLEDLARELEWFKEALTLPVLTLDDMPRRHQLGHRVIVARTFHSSESWLSLNWITPRRAVHRVTPGSTGSTSAVARSAAPRRSGCRAPHPQSGILITSSS